MAQLALPERFGDYAVLGFQAEERGGIGWWQTCIASSLIDLSRIEGFIPTLSGIAKVLRGGADPAWVVGAPDAAAALGVAHEWLAAGIRPDEVETWLLAGCWSPRHAQALAAAGVHPRELLDDAGQPAQWVPVQDGQSVPVALAVVEWDLPVDQAVQIIKSWSHMVCTGPPPRPTQQPGPELPKLARSASDGGGSPRRCELGLHRCFKVPGSCGTRWGHDKERR